MTKNLLLLLPKRKERVMLEKEDFPNKKYRHKEERNRDVTRLPHPYLQYYTNLKISPLGFLDAICGRSRRHATSLGCA